MTCGGLFFQVQVLMLIMRQRSPAHGNNKAGLRRSVRPYLCAFVYIVELFANGVPVSILYIQIPCKLYLLLLGLL